ncbi:ATP-binding cassette domain-containing protein [Compostibacter hankyongensis]|uniref:ATP-binding cassette domain-containing protein n=1 Tax=Compostibacter hankyongensis TaxID=1007089 RepID=A0ABP8FHT1_9BACT
MQTDHTALLVMDHLTVRYTDQVLFEDLSFRLNRGEQWAVTGPSGSGKSTFLNTLLGKYNISGGGIRYPFFADYAARHTITDPLFNFRNLIAVVSHHHHFRNLSHTTDFYYQQRFHAYDSDDAPTVRAFLEQTADRVSRQVAGLRPRFTPADIETLLLLTPLLDKTLIKLSNGETRRLMIAAALMQQPELLLLDSPFTGLDVQTRAFFHELLEKFIAAGITIILVTTPQELPDCITHVLELDAGKVKGAFTRKQYLQLREAQREASATGPFIDPVQLEKLTPAGNEDHRFSFAVRMENVKVKYGDTMILDDISWKVERGSKWALTGPNGAGKSTLLSLITGDNPQAYANKIYLFDRRRGSGESIWELKRKTGFVSPELHQYFTSANTCKNVVLSGFFDTMGLQHKPTEEQVRLAEEWMQLLAIASLSEKKFRQVSASEQRLVLLARALVKNPPLLILDEPCQGLDQEQKARFKKIIEAVCDRPGKTLIYVSHYREEIPACVTRSLQLKNGKIDRLVI